MSMPEPPRDDVPTEDAGGVPAAGQPPTDPPSSRGRTIALVAGVAVLAAAMGWFAIQQGSGRNEPPVTLAGDGITLTLPPGWNGTTDMTALPEIEGLTPPQEDQMRQWMGGLARDDRVRLLGIDGFDSVAVLAVEDIGDAALRDLADAYVEDGVSNGFELLDRGETTVDGDPAATVASVNDENGEETFDVIWIEDGTVWVVTWSTEIGRIAEIRSDIDVTMAGVSTP
jgi:hypothetical protein